MGGVLKQGSFLDVVKMVLAGLVGIRRKADHETASVNPVHVIVTAFVLVLLFIIALIAIVRIVIS
jgi:hypothetical protein